MAKAEGGGVKVAAQSHAHPRCRETVSRTTPRTPTPTTATGIGQAAAVAVRSPRDVHPTGDADANTSTSTGGWIQAERTQSHSQPALIARPAVAAASQDRGQVSSCFPATHR